MTWLKKDDKFPNHRKIRRLSDGAYRLHDTALCYASHDESDGKIAPDDLDEMQHGRRLKRNVSELVAAGLWEPLPGGGWLLHDFLDYNPSHAQLEAERSANRDRQAKLRAKRRGVVADESDNAVSNGVTNGVTTGGVTRESHPPVPDRTEPFPSVPTQPASGVLSVVGGEDQIQHVAVGNGRRSRPFGLGGDA
jgi:hypothetical protein